METIVYKGFIKGRDYGEGHGLFLSGQDEPLAEQIMYDLDENTKQCSIRFYISDTEKTIEQLREDRLHSLSGGLMSRFRHAYSEYTGYLWTDEDLMIGNHDLLSDLYFHEGKYLHLEIDIH